MWAAFASRRLAAAAVIVVMLAGAGVGAWLLWPDPAQPQVPDAVVVRTTADPGEGERLAVAIAAVESLPGALARGDTHLLAAAARERFAEGRNAIPAGAQLKVDPASWRRTGAAASVLVTMTVVGEGKPRQFTCVLVFEEGEWKVSGTYPVSQP